MAGAAMWQQRDPTLDLDGLDHLGQGLLVSPSAQWEVSFALEDDREDPVKAVPELALCHPLEYNCRSI